MRTYSRVILFLLIIGQLSCSFSESSNLDIRLPREVVPFFYSIQLLPILEQNLLENVSGYEEILLQCKRDSRNITLHSKDIAINKVQVVELETARPIAVLYTTNDSTLDFLIIHLEQSLVAGNEYQLSINFAPILRDDMRGLYRSSYEENGVTK
jgi:Peptidase M1 N-terminal domain